MMIDDNLLFIVLAVLTAGTALNLFLILRLAALVRAWTEPATRAFPIGEAVPPFEGRRRMDGHRIASVDLAGAPLVLVFLSSGCRVCRGKVAEIAEILPGLGNAGVTLWIVPADDTHDIAKIVEGPLLLDRVLELDAATRRTLNPQRAAPYYLFIDENMIAKAGSYVGDEDWRTFVDQMRDFAVPQQGAR